MKKLPQGWSIRQLDEIADVAGGIQKGPHRDPGANPVRYLTVAHVQRNRIVLDDPRFFEVTSEELKRWRLSAGDNLIIEGNGSASEIGRTALFRGEIPNCVHQNHVIRARPRPELLYPVYLNAFLNSSAGQLALQAKAFSSSGLRTLSVGRVRELSIPLPPLPEQQKIADILGTWDEALEKLDVLIAAKARRKQALMQQLLTGKLRQRGFKTLAWKSVRMAEVLERVFRPIEVEQSESLALVSIRRRLGGLFRRPDVLASDYKTQDLHAIKAGDFLISKRQVVHGAWAIVEPAFDGTLVSKEYAIFVNYAPQKLDMRFFAWLAQTPRMLRLARVASTGVHIEKLIFDPDVFLREQIRIPSDIKEQAAVAAILDAADAELRIFHQQRAALDHQKRGLMQQLLTGQIRTLAK